MYERFTDRARKVMQLANQEAQRFNHEYVGTEHILLGLIKEGSGIAGQVLKNMDLDLAKVREEVCKLLKSGPDMVTMGKMPHTPRSKKVLDYAIEESRSLAHSYVGTEHILLGLIREKEGVAAQVLANFGCDLDVVRRHVMELLTAGRCVPATDDNTVKAIVTAFQITNAAHLRSLALQAALRLEMVGGEVNVGLARELREAADGKNLRWEVEGVEIAK